jgi:hypothetical protein
LVSSNFSYLGSRIYILAWLNLNEHSSLTLAH